LINYLNNNLIKLIDYHLFIILKNKEIYDFFCFWRNIVSSSSTYHCICGIDGPAKFRSTRWDLSIRAEPDKRVRFRMRDAFLPGGRVAIRRSPWCRFSLQKRDEWGRGRHDA